MELKDVYRWTREYTWGIDLSKIDWVVMDTYQLMDSRNFDLENQFSIAIDNQKGQIKSLKKMDACPPRLYL